MPSADLYPLSLSALVRRLDLEIGAGGALFGLKRRDWWVPRPGLDVSMRHMGKRIATPSGPASGPHTQLAQNLLMSWLTGGRFMELKTVQVNDELVIPRPCIHAPHLGFNVEWSQELRTWQSSLEYVKGWMLVHMVASEHGPGLWSEVGASWDLSLGYDLAGIRADKVLAFVEQLRDASELIELLRESLPGELQRWADVPVPAAVCDSVTLSTFHGCPAGEIEAIAAQTLDWGLHTVIKLNPTLLGYERARGLMDRMGYDDIQLDAGAFAKDLQWSQLLPMVEHLRSKASGQGLGFGVKFSNTLVCRSAEPPFDQEEMYLSGPPLYVLAMSLASELRAEVGPELPITFSAGIDKGNFAQAVAGGLGPVTACTDLLKGKGYARQTAWLRALEDEMSEPELADLASFRAHERAVQGRDPLQAAVDGLAEESRYHRSANAVAPRKIGSRLVLLDCLTCDKCVPVCPNGANFAVELERGEHQPGRLSWSGSDFSLGEGLPLLVDKRHQIGNLADACNLCGQCDVWCPEDGGPHLVKPTLFVSARAFWDNPERDGFLLESCGALRWRRGGDMLRWKPTSEGRAVLATPEGQVLLQGDSPISTEGRGDLDLRDATTMRLFASAFRRDAATLFLPVPAPVVEPE
ncbi:MAG TPA: glutamate synthase [Myxococcota bacterium]|nr:glutamate synthase [Myxococcota bacterium]